MMQQLSDDWFRARAGKFTASRSKALMAKTKSGPSASRKNLIAQLAVERITGVVEDGYSNAAMQRGIDLEPEARDAYIFETGNAVDEVAFVTHPEMAYCGASPDGLVGEDGLVEIKCPSAMAKHMAALTDGAHAKEYFWQLQHQLFVTGRDWVDAVSYDPRFPDGLQLAVKRVLRDESAIDELKAEITNGNDEVNEMVDKMNGLRSPEIAKAEADRVMAIEGVK